MTARKPEEIHELFAQAYQAGDLEGILALYETEATFVLQSGERVRGHAAIREALRNFLVAKPRFELQQEQVVQADDIALIISRWTIDGASPDGQPARMEGRTADVARRQPDGRWLVVIDHPYGGGGGQQKPG